MHAVKNFNVALYPQNILYFKFANFILDVEDIMYSYSIYMHLILSVFFFSLQFNLTHTVDSLVCCLRPCPSGTASSSYGNMTKYRGHCTSHYRGSTVAGSISSHQCWCCFPETEICRPTSSLNPIPLYFFFSTAVICI